MEKANLMSDKVQKSWPDAIDWHTNFADLVLLIGTLTLLT